MRWSECCIIRLVLYSYIQYYTAQSAKIPIIQTHRFTSWQAILASVHWQASKWKRTIEVSHLSMEVNTEFTRIIGIAMNMMDSKKSVQRMNFQPRIRNSTYVTSC